jgi:hypothetical protein
LIPAISENSLVIVRIIRTKRLVNIPAEKEYTILFLNTRWISIKRYRRIAYVEIRQYIGMVKFPIGGRLTPNIGISVEAPPRNPVRNPIIIYLVCVRLMPFVLGRYLTTSKKLKQTINSHEITRNV